MNNEFEYPDFMTEDEIDEIECALAAEVMEEIQKEMSGTLVLNPVAVKNLLLIYEIMKRLVKGTKATVKYSINKPMHHMGVVSVTSKNAQFTNTKWFATAIKLASNFDVYGRSNGDVTIDFGFNNITVKAE